METWWQRYPEQLDAEKAALVSLGWPWEIDQSAFAEGRLVVFVTRASTASGELRLTAEYPATYPYFHPHVSLDRVVFSRHQHPIAKNLCLLARESENWRPGLDTLAELIREQLPRIEAINESTATPSSIAQQEDHVGEPVSSFLNYTQNSALIVPDEDPAGEHCMGKLVVEHRLASPDNSVPGWLNGMVSEVRTIKGQVLSSMSVDPKIFPARGDGFWMRLQDRPNLSTESALYQELFSGMLSAHPLFKKAIARARRGSNIVAGFLYKDETQWREIRHDWLFLNVRIVTEAKGARVAKCLLSPVRTDWGGEKALMQRAPFLLPLRKKTALVFGLGSLGSPVALQLARAGLGKLILMDRDYLQVGNTIRWALGWEAAGFDKVDGLGRYIRRNYPYTETATHQCHLGANSRPSTEFFSDYEFLRKLVSETDVVVDASANHGVSHFLADLSRELRKPYIWLTTTHGCAGGIVGRQLQQPLDGCWHCFLHGLAEQTIKLPAEDATAEIQPGGCSQATFVGAGVDSDEISLLASRLTLATLTRGELGYPDFDWNVAVCDVRENERSIAPRWTTYPLRPHSACTHCGTQ